MSALPPGPKTPRLFQTLQWVRKPIPLMQTCVKEYGECFTLRWLNTPPIAFFSDPAAIKQIFTASPDQALAGRGNVILKPILVSTQYCCLMARATNGSVNCSCRRFMANACASMATSCVRPPIGQSTTGRWNSPSPFTNACRLSRWTSFCGPSLAWTKVRCSRNCGLY